MAPRKDTKQQVEKILQKLCFERNHTWKLLNLTTVLKTEIEITCLKHNVSTRTTVKQYKQSLAGGTPCCKKAKRANNLNIKEIAEKKVLNRLREVSSKRGHEISNISYKGSVNCFFTVYCPKHKKTYENIQYTNYTHANTKWVIKCCSLEVNPNRKVLWYQQVLELAEKRNHQISEWDYRGKTHCLFSVTCLIHNQKFDEVLFGDYTSPSNRKTSGTISCCAKNQMTFEAERQNNFQKKAKTNNHKLFNLAENSDKF